MKDKETKKGQKRKLTSLRSVNPVITAAINIIICHTAAMSIPGYIKKRASLLSDDLCDRRERRKKSKNATKKTQQGTGKTRCLACHKFETGLNTTDLTRSYQTITSITI